MNFEKLTAYIDNLKNEGIPGSDLIVFKDHECIYRHFTGLRDREKNIPMNGKELYWIYSASKVHTCTAALQLVEKGLIGLDDPVGKYLPVYNTLSVIENGRVRAAWKTMTVRHLFAMQGGLNYDIESPSIMKAKFYSGNKADTLTLVNAMAEEPLSFDPGTHFLYSLCHDVLAAIVEVVSGMKFSEYLRKNIWDKLGMVNVGFTLTEDMMDRFATQYEYDEATHTSHLSERGISNRYQLTPNYESGGAGLITSVEDYILLSDALACGGVGKSGAQILTGESIDQMRTPQLCEEARKIFRLPGRPGYTYGLGVRVMVEPQYSRSPAGEFGWDGAAGAFLMAIPEKRLSLFYVQHVLSCSHAFEVIHPTIRDLVCQIVDA